MCDLNSCSFVFCEIFKTNHFWSSTKSFPKGIIDIDNLGNAYIIRNKGLIYKIH